MQGVLIFIQLLLAEGQEQNSDLTEVYIIFYSKTRVMSTISFFPNLATLRASSHWPSLQGRQGASDFWASKEPGLAKLFYHF